MNLIFISSFLNVPCVLSTVQTTKKDFRIITANKQLYNYFNDFYNKEVSILLPDSDVKLNNFFALIFSKNKFLRKLKSLKPKNIYFFYLGHNGLLTWLISNLSKEATVYYRLKVKMNIDNANFDYSFLFIKILIKKFLLNLIFVNKFRNVMWYGHQMIIIPKNFLRNIKATDYYIDDKSIYQTLVQKNYLQYSKELLLLCGGELYVQEAQLLNLIKKIVQYNNEYRDKKKLVVKFHPDYPFDRELFIDNIDNRIEVIPGNLLCYFSENIISYNSAVLYEGANLGKKSISLLEMVETKNIIYKKKIRRYLEDNLNKGSKIYFPQNFNELVNVLYS